MKISNNKNTKNAVLTVSTITGALRIYKCDLHKIFSRPPIIVFTYARPSSIILHITLSLASSMKSGLSGFLLISTSCQGAMLPKRTQLKMSNLYLSLDTQSCLSHLTADMNTSISLKSVLMRIMTNNFDDNVS